jgi:23S rRNA (adenine2503-C2)-methyltransferase
MGESKGLNYSQTRITVSTVGIVHIIREIADSDFKFYLAVSLICADNDKRQGLVPINSKYPLEELISACSYYNKKKGEIYFEYILFDGVNDSTEDAHTLVNALKGLKYKVNLIPYNNTGLGELRAPARERILAFQDVIKRAGKMAFIRKEKGADIAAACGQLAGQKAKG